VATRLLGELGAFARQEVEWLTRLPFALLTLGALALAGRWAFPSGRSVTAAWVGAALAGILLEAGDWAQHAGEARMYSLMGVLAVAMVLAAARGSVLPACACGLGLVVLHPFGSLIGWAPTLAALGCGRLGLAGRLGLTSRQIRRLGWSALGVFLVVGLWIQLKFIGHQTGGYGLRRRGGDMATVLRGLDLRLVTLFAAVALCGLAAAATAARRVARAGDVVAPAPGAYAAAAGAALCLTLGLGVATLAIVRPGVNVAMPRYVSWANPALLAGAVAGLGRGLDVLLRRLGVEARPRLAAGLSLASAAVAGLWSLQLVRTVPLGPTWADGLRETAQHLERVVGQGDAITTDMRELFLFFPPYTDGYACRRSPQLVPYLSPARRALIPCQDRAGRVVFGPEVRPVFLVREPIPVIEGRTVVLEGFGKAGEERIGNVRLERWERGGG
jgi:hypothetical protein